MPNYPAASHARRMAYRGAGEMSDLRGLPDLFPPVRFTPFDRFIRYRRNALNQAHLDPPR